MLPVKLTETDYPAIIELWETSVRASHNFLKSEEIDFYKPLVLKYGLPQSNLYGIYSNSVLAGYIGIRGQKIEMLFIHPDFFGQGLGTELLQFAIKQQHCTLIDVNEENPRAYKFYLKHGFKLNFRDEKDDCDKPHPILHLKLSTTKN